MSSLGIRLEIEAIPIFKSKDINKVSRIDRVFQVVMRVTSFLSLIKSNPYLSESTRDKRSGLSVRTAVPEMRQAHQTASQLLSTPRSSQSGDGHEAE